MTKMKTPIYSDERVDEILQQEDKQKSKMDDRNKINVLPVIEGVQRVQRPISNWNTNLEIIYIFVSINIFLISLINLNVRYFIKYSKIN